jgi:simple sugar transport system permease protein
MDINFLAQVLQGIIRSATPLALGAYCGVLSERAGVVNIAIEGIMLTSALVGYAVGVVTKNFLIAASAGILTGGLLALFHAFVSITLKTDQIVSGTVINILAYGVTGVIYRRYISEAYPIGAGTFPVIKIPLLSDIPIVGTILFQHQPIVYLMFILTFLVHYVLFYTPWGLRSRAVGEHPHAADTLGIDVYFVRYVNVVAGGLIAGLAGIYFTLESSGTFSIGMTSGRGFISLAAMIFGKWTPGGSLLASLIFGAGDHAQIVAQTLRPDIPSQLLNMAPYIITMIVLAGFIGRAIPPAADGQPYEKQ